MLYGVTPLHPLTFLSAPDILLATAAVAVWLPARRAARVDPTETLRGD
jgi:ABC-type lipoprotein release transport system permease subunit